MIDYLLKQVNEVFPTTADDISEETWKNESLFFLSELKKVFDYLIAMSSFCLPGKEMSNHKVEYLLSSFSRHSVADIRLRPSSEYYANSLLDIPSPENPKGQHATGLALEVSLFRGSDINGIITPPSLLITFEVWGAHERLAFQELYADYRRPVTLLLEKLALKITTACCFEKLDNYKGSKISKKLDLYFDELDEEHSISFEKEFSFNQDIQEIAQTFLILLTLYYSCHGYAKKRKEKDRILEPFHLLTK